MMISTRKYFAKNYFQISPCRMPTTNVSPKKSRGCLPDESFSKLLFFTTSRLRISIVFRDTEVDTSQLYGTFFLRMWRDIFFL